MQSRILLASTATLALASQGALFTPPAWAKRPAPTDFSAARTHYTNAENAAKAGDWAKAAKEYGIAYEITRDPVLFFKLGTAYQLSGDCTRAVEYFERYLKEANPSEDFQRDTRERITECQASAPATESNNPQGDVQGS